jgi:hypothetical protein
MPQSVTISWVASPVTGVWRRIGHCALIHTSARSAPWRSTTRLAMCSARVSTNDDVDRLLEELREARHVDALLVRREVDRAVDHGCHHGLGVSPADPDGLLHASNAGVRQRETDLGRRGLQVVVEPDDVGHAITVPAPVSAAAARVDGP